MLPNRTPRQILPQNRAVHAALQALAGLLLIFPPAPTLRAVPANDYPSLQAAIDANPGRVIDLPAGDYEIGTALRLEQDGTGLAGFGRIIQTNPAASIIHIRGARGVRLRDLTLMRPLGRTDTAEHAVRVSDSEDVEIDGLQVLDNRSLGGTILLERSRHSRVQGCRVKNYKRVGIDDRTASDLYGYAFRVIDGTGILLTECVGVSLLHNSVIEANLFPTAETKARHQLGQLTDGRLPMKKGRLAPKGDYANNWHQGSAIVVTSPEKTRAVQIIGNYVESAAQGIDIHADHVVCSQNVIDKAFIGIKCMHGSRNVIITGNNVSRFDYWGLIMMPGTASHPAEPAKDGRPARAENVTAGNVIANNTFSDFGRGDEYFNWSGNTAGIISLESGQLAENPVMTDVVISGNVVYDSSRDESDEAARSAAPRYDFAVFISPEPRPRGLRFANNLFHPGKRGVSNIDLATFGTGE